MQKYLKDILSNPPNSVSSISTFLLLVSVILFLSIFIMGDKHEDVTLNLLYNSSQEKVVVSPKWQLSNSDYDTLINRVQLGEKVERGDTLFTTLSVSEIAEIEKWKQLLDKGDLMPTAEMTSRSFVDKAIREKMIALARVKTAPRPVNNKRIAQLKKDVQELTKSVDEYQNAILKFESLSNSYAKDFAKAKEEYEDRLITKEELARAKRKLDDNEAMTNQRRQQLKTEKLLLFNAKSELDALNTRKTTQQRLKKTGGDFTEYEVDLVNSLDSLLKQNVILAQYEGVIKFIGSRSNVTKSDTLIGYAGSEEIQINRSQKLFAKADPKDANLIYPGKELIILLQDGSSVGGEVVGVDNSNKYHFEIASTEVISEVDIDQIILPAKNENFIEKVLQNF